MKQQRQRLLVDDLGYSGVPPRMARKGFAHFITDTAERAQRLNHVKQFAEAVVAGESDGRWLLMIGPTGVGKSHLAAASVRAAIAGKRSAVFASAMLVMQVVKESYRVGSDTSERAAVAKWVEPDLLVIDELGVQRGTDFERTMMTELLNRRYEQLKSTVLISNLPLEAPAGRASLSELLGDRVISRMREVADVLVFTGEDYRRGAA